MKREGEQMRRIIVLMWLFVVSFCFTGFLHAREATSGNGADKIIFEKIRMNPVTFPHHLHQKALENNCNACHDLFPKQPGIIRELINQKKLQHQQVMNSKCIACHKARVAEGKKTGPVKCTECHVRTQ
jgi:hypothetical protein